ncbi:DUF6069 family protein [Luteimicrobium sp. DT211]|uniref:DUF6069 family protein n=1 Tax=Luteimicrobium sp. DT211 TaxID=3393412 RepID=UPI003CF00405
MTTTILPGVSRAARTWPVWWVNVLAGLAAAVATELYGLVARASGVPMEAASPGASAPTAVTVGMFAMGTLVATFWSTPVVLAVARWARRPARTYRAIAVVVLVVSFLAPLTSTGTATATKVVLCGAHVLAASIIVPVVAARLGVLR